LEVKENQYKLTSVKAKPGNERWRIAKNKNKINAYLHIKNNQ
jgi:hypothetical protein